MKIHDNRLLTKINRIWYHLSRAILNKEPGQVTKTINKAAEPTKTIEMPVYHGSTRDRDIPDIEFPGPREDCDFGRGFYVTQHKAIAEEWVINEAEPVINKYMLKAPEREILRLTGRDWLKVVIGFRTNALQTTFKSPIVCGTIANDRLVPSFNAFMGETIGDLRLLECLDLAQLGDQYLLRESAEYLKWEGSYILKGAELDRAVARNQQRMQNMHNRVRAIYRKQIAGEKFIYDYLEEGGYVED